MARLTSASNRYAASFQSSVDEVADGNGGIVSKVQRAARYAGAVACQVEVGGSVNVLKQPRSGRLRSVGARSMSADPEKSLDGGEFSSAAR